MKTIRSINEAPTSSRLRLAGLISTHTSTKLNLSINTPSNGTIKTSRIRGSDSFSIPSKRSIVYPLTAFQASESLKDYLNEYEICEIFEYKEIHYIGIGASKVFIDQNLPNFGFDNDKGDYKICLRDHINYRYEVLSAIGKGSFGQVCKCFDHKTKELVALKIIKNKKKFHKQGIIEVNLLKNMKDNDPGDYFNIIRIKDSFFFRNHLCITFELLSMNLYEFIKFNNFQRMSLSLVARFAVQILNGLQYAGSLGIIHCDLKPENILLKHPDKSGIKLIDFGSGCYETERVYTYIQSRFYRAPEIMLGIPYTKSIDM